jgi:hypothetical protein
MLRTIRDPTNHEVTRGVPPRSSRRRPRRAVARRTRRSCRRS